TTTPTMAHQNCFYTRTDASLTYQSTADLNGIRLGAITDYGYGGELDVYIQRHYDDRMRLQLLSGSNPDQRLNSMLNSQRIDAFISDSYVTRWQLHQSETTGQTLREAGCLPAMPFYAGISRQYPRHKELIDWLNAELGL